MFPPPKPGVAPTPPVYAWDEHPEAVLGTIYLYFSSNCDPMQISDQRMRAFIAQHQDDNATLTDKQVITAVQAVRALDGRSGPRPGKVLIALWSALSTARESLPVYRDDYRAPAGADSAEPEQPDVAALLAAFVQD
jgi:hypothetical protein